MIYVKKIKEIIFWFMYKFLLKMVSSNYDEPELNSDLQESSNGVEESIWFFCSTIGELNACSSFIDKKYAKTKIVFITDRIFYKDSFLDKYPNASVLEVKSESSNIESILNRYSPQEFYICEIPCSPNDAPCRFPYEVLRAIKKSGAKIYIINGWLYQYEPACMQDKIERFLFSRYYIQMFDGITVQAESVKDFLVEKGADKDRICVTGNMKFDALYNQKIYTRDNVSEFLIKQLSKTKHVVVAGCLINEFEYEQVAKAFSEVLMVFPDAVFVFAPRHPEKQDQLNFIEKILNENNLTYEFKSKITNLVDFNKKVLVLDTLGELKVFYSVGAVCYVGRDHNILEPLFLNKKVIVPEGWNNQYPSYPVFDIVNKKGLVTVHKEKELGNDLITLMQSGSQNFDINKALVALSGVTERNEKFFKSIDSEIGS
ncbi:3-deoxy-D-manno-octulosonic acid transferase [Neptunomonas japonica]|uniref:3-deoxy-D-manno-octulosonic acid transferase n=1 Tax=Neptunomonas japonica JAMM 1380 TaxID=1441457 RepID=A0A7R6P7N6_9GAMM|nr:glycosyltransferase N-terminal domain-containing protein [Neptunomonas japonica]BBB28759.1 3-deoxy-D-manno-octulosonic-acid transferase [Neptunomonas japonica JAMM 1380]